MENQVRDGSGQLRDARGGFRDGSASQSTVKRRMTVSAALKWAWSDELPKEPASGKPPPGMVSVWNSISHYSELSTMIDRQPNRYGCIPFDQSDFPHPDALLIAGAVTALSDMVVDVPDGWNPMPEIAAADRDLGDKAVRDALDKVTVQGADGDRRFRMRPDALIIRYAILGGEPDWQLDKVPVKKLVCNERGTPKWFVQNRVPQIIGENPDGSDKIEYVAIESDGWSARGKRPLPGAYQKNFLDPDPVPVIVERAEYEIWHSALTVLHDDLAAKLETIRLQPDCRPLRPWEDDTIGGRRRPRILPDLRGPLKPA